MRDRNPAAARVMQGHNPASRQWRPHVRRTTWLPSSAVCCLFALLLFPMQANAMEISANSSCPAGYTYTFDSGLGIVNISCQPCPQGTFKSMQGSGPCTVCPNRGAYTHSASTAETDCIGGTPTENRCPVRSHDRQEVETSWCPYTPEVFQWCDASLGPGEMNRYGHTLTAVQDFVVLFGGIAYHEGFEAWGSADDRFYVLDTASPRMQWLPVGVQPIKPPARFYHTAVAYKNKIVVYGGQTLNSEDVFTPWELDLRTLKWQSTSPRGSPPHDSSISPESSDGGAFERSGHSAVVVGTEMIVFGGVTGVTDASCLGDAWSLDLETWVWSELSTQGGPTALCWHSAVVSGSKMLVLGGYSDVDRTTSSTSVWELDLDTLQWAEVGQTTSFGNDVKNAVVFQGQVVVLGGDCTSSSCEASVLDAATHTWSDVHVVASHVPSAVEYAAEASGQRQEIVATPSLLFLFGGVASTPVSAFALVSAEEGQTVSSMHIREISHAVPEFEALPATPDAREGSAASVVGDHVYIFGGIWSWVMAPGDLRFGVLGDTWALDLRTASWALVEASGPGPDARHGHSMVNIGGDLVVFGGAVGFIAATSWLPCAQCNATSGGSGGQAVVDRAVEYAAKDDTWVLNVATRSWVALSTAAAPPPREGHTAVAMPGGGMVVLGGVNYRSVNNAYRGFAATNVLQLEDVWELGPGGQWTELTPSGEGPGPIHHHAAVAYNGSMFVTGGMRHGAAGELEFFSDAFVLSQSSAGAWSWAKLAAPGVVNARAGHTAVLVGSSVLVFGGITASQAAGCGATQDLECVVESDASFKVRLEASPQPGMEWAAVAVADAPTPRSGHVAVVANADVFVMGGSRVWVEAAAVWKIQFQNMALLPISAVVREEAGVQGGAYLGLAVHFMSVLLPGAAALPGAWVRASHVVVEPRRVALGGRAAVDAGGRIALLCASENACDDLRLHRLDVGGGGTRVAAALLDLASASASVEACSFRDIHSESAGAVFRVRQGGFLHGSQVEVKEASASGGGGAVAVFDSHVELSACVFDAVSTDGEGGAIRVVADAYVAFEHEGSNLRFQQPQLTLHGAAFSNCDAAAGGGAIACGPRTRCAVASSSFLRNSASNFSSGGALLARNAALSVAESTFTDNTARGGGGGSIFWQGLEPDVGNAPHVCQYADVASSDAALFGPCVATNAVAMVAAGPTNFTAQMPGVPLDPRLRARLVDVYGQTVRVGNGRPVVGHAWVPEPRDGLLLGASAVIQGASTEAFDFWDLAVMAAWSAEEGLQSPVELQLLSRDPYTAAEVEMEGVWVHFSAGVCESGFVLSVQELETPSGEDEVVYGRCLYCEAGTYSLDPEFVRPVGSPGCLNCPIGATCSGGDNFEGNLGNWVSDGGMYNLTDGCPEGHARLGLDSVEHDQQQCEACRTDGSEYVVRNDADSCQRCPAGLICFGNSSYVPRLNGSTWEIDTGRFVLVSCPSGHFVHGEPGHYEQECQPCPLGSTCTDADCVACSACAAGRYKDWIGEGGCAKCPVSTFNPDEGATDVNQCRPCAETLAFTLEAGAASEDHCVCAQSHYLAFPGGDNFTGGERTCVPCPRAARCHDGTCSLVLKNQSCGSVGPATIGTWQRDRFDDLFHLAECPDGYQIYEAEPEDYTYWDLSMCVQCKSSQYYIADGPCQDCPTGLQCFGGDVVIPRVENSTWVPDGHVYRLTQCPAGYYRFVGAEIEDQECITCPLGSECTAGGCDGESECTLCPAGKYKDAPGPEACSDCPRGTFSAEVGASDWQTCQSCPDGATTDLGSTDESGCRCAAEYYLPVGVSQGQLECIICPVGALCTAGGCAFALSTNLSCPGEGRIIGEWPLNANGSYFLVSCPSGHSLVNSTDGDNTGEFSYQNQFCRRCEMGTEYVLFPDRQQCQVCPPGLFCFGNETVEPVIAGSEWEVVDGVYHLISCPAGYSPVNLHDPTLHECAPCQPGSFCDHDNCTACDLCPPGSYKGEWGPGECNACPQGTYREGAGGTRLTSCSACPSASSTDSTGHTSPYDCHCAGLYYFSFSEDTGALCNVCPIGGVCPQGECGLAPKMNMTCSDGTPVVGEWELQEDERYHLLWCPEGYSLVNSTDGTSQGQWAHDLQQCKKCLSPTEYVLRPNHDTCLECPPGLQCHGNSTVTPTTPGASWETTLDEDGNLRYSLVDCPTGHEALKPDNWLHECEPCGRGEHCPDERCTECSPCPAGSYKEVQAAHECRLCPENTYGTVEGATAVAQCAHCPRYAFSLETGQTSIDTCTCDASYYPAMGSGGDLRCMECPVGAVCFDLTCALRFENHTCADGTRILGDWARDDEGQYVLEQCPDATSLINSTVGTSEGTFSHKSQQCDACESAPPNTEYIINPNTDQCQPCPPGLRCSGGISVDPVVESEWEIVNDHYELVSCGANYRPSTAAGPEYHECVGCEAGSHCLSPPCTACSECPAGTYKDASSPVPCSECPSGTYNPIEGAASRALCVSCGIGATTNGTGKTSAYDCNCGENWFRMERNQTGPYCASCPEGATCHDGSCALVAEPPYCAGVAGTWEQGDGTFTLVRCPPGHSLQNEIAGAFSYEAQRCEACAPGFEYVINPNTHDCQPCPPGLECDGSDAAGGDLEFEVVPEGSDLPPIGDGALSAPDGVEAVTEGAEWVIDGEIWALRSCPRGHQVFNESVELQECDPCPAGQECDLDSCTVCHPCPAGTYKDTAGTYMCRACPMGTYREEPGADAITLCKECPPGAETNASGAVSASECKCGLDHYKTTLEDPFECLRCPVGATCPDQSCAFHTPGWTCNGEPILGTWVQGPQGMYRLTGCPDGYELVNSTDGDSSGEFSHDAQRCRKCFPNEYVINPSTDSCRECPPGLRCDGTSHVIKVVPGSEWVQYEDAYKLVACPAGYRLENATLEAQECVPCGKGRICASEQCTTCLSCPTGTYKDAAGPQECMECPLATYNPDQGSPTIAECRPCPAGATTHGTGKTSIDACSCDLAHYVAVSADNADTFSCVTCPIGGVCADGTCAFGVSSAENECVDGTEVVGSWSRDAESGTVILRHCPSGYSLQNSTRGTSSGVFFHDGQQCADCVPGLHYVLNPNTDACQVCPPGLTCFGNSTYFPVTPGSIWAPRGPVLVLESCPTGYFAFTEGGFEYQECLPCSVGLQCVEAACVNCTMCPPGTYKDFSTAQPCRPCPENTFGADHGARSIGQCRRCPDGASTNGGEGQSAASACQCDSRLYLADIPSSGLTCVTCPAGGVCSDGSCGLSAYTAPSPSNGTWSESWAEFGTCAVVGDWFRDAEDLWRLRSCQGGYMLINSTSQSSDGIFSHDAQQCLKCPGNTYILDPMDECRACPLGLICDGDASPVPRTEGAVWLPQGPELVLVSCPTGYSVSDPSPQLQQCLPCGAGQDCAKDNCTSCSPCQPGTYKPSGGPYLCQACPHSTFNPTEGAISLSQCSACPAGAITEDAGQTSVYACHCSWGYPSQLPSNGTFAESDAEYTFSCLTCPQGARCSDGSCALTNPDMVCHDGSEAPIVGDWERSGPDGEYLLQSCPDGYARIVTSDGTLDGDFHAPSQRCQACQAMFEYIINPNTDLCQPCPPGLSCNGTKWVRPVNPGAVWEVCDSCGTSGSVYILESCPEGNSVFNDTVAAQECAPCGYGASCEAVPCVTCSLCPPGKFKPSPSPAPCSLCPFNTYGLETGAADLAQCTRCNDGAYTLQRGASTVDQCLCPAGTYPTNHPEPADRRCLDCPVGARCDDGSCAFANANWTCPTTGDPVGDWEQVTPAEGGIWLLQSCPDGYSLLNSSEGTSRGTFEQSLQECRPCEDGKEYIIDPNRHQCQPCPLGLLCDGTSGVEPRVPNSTWVPDGAIYRLLGCGPGHRVVNGGDVFNAVAQNCEQCGRGEECTSQTCTQCTPCAPGSYKDNTSPEPCQECPVHTYGPDQGASALESCTSCPFGSFTEGAGQTELSACVCSEQRYTAVHQETREMACMACPIGAICGDATCALRREDLSCVESNGDLVPAVGTWEQDAVDQTFTLRDCPDGYRLVLSFDGTATGPFAHDAQTCLPCPPSSYILGPSFECNPCPDGLICSGVAAVTPRVFGSTWVPVEDVYHLVSCPTGYTKLAPEDIATATNNEIIAQNCEPCGSGEECTLEVCQNCTKCEPGFYKQNAGPAACVACPVDTFGSEEGMSACTPCPTGSGTLRVGESSAAACECAPSLYLSSADLAANEVTCTDCPAGALCANGFCALRYGFNLSCPDTGPIIGNWVEDSEGVYYLRSCPPGYSLLNTTGDEVFEYTAQICVKCDSDQYISKPNRHECQECPAGLECRGDNVVTPKVNGSIWDLQVVIETTGNTTVWAETAAETYRLLVCPTGYRKIAEPVELQRCEPCGFGLQCDLEECEACEPCPPGSYKDTKSTQLCTLCPQNTFNPLAGATSSANCLKCPESAVTEAAGATSFEQCACGPTTYIINDPEAGLTCQTCPIGGRCADNYCGLREESLQCLDGEAIVGDWSREGSGEFRLSGCPDGYSLITSLDGTSSGRFFHDAQQCKMCEPGREYIVFPNHDQCQRCPPGLHCFGNQTVVPTVPGSVWERNGSIFELIHCPAGYSKYTGPPGKFLASAQQCRPCDLGFFCSEETCTECFECPAGSYKDETGPGACKLCRVDTYQSTRAATTAAQCFPCPPFSHTDGPGATNASQCGCEIQLYLQHAPGLNIEPACITCPAGAVCSDADARACGLVLPGWNCNSTGRILGEWSKTSEGRWWLDSCPAGHMLVNSTLGSSFGDHAHDAQQCYPCKTCADGVEWCGTAEYVVDPNRFKCKPCPYGAECNGSELRTKDELDLLGARWGANEVGELWLQACPVGFQLLNTTGYENQACHKCADGQYVLASDNPEFSCHDCPAGAQCPNGGPPIFNVQAVRFSFTINGLANSTADYTMRQNAVIMKSLENTLQAPPGSVEITGVCDSAGQNCQTPSELRRQILLGSGGGRRRSLLQAAPGLSIATSTVSDVVDPSTFLERLQSPTFTEDLANEMVQIEPSFSGIQIPLPPPPAIQDLPASKGEVYRISPDGRALLVDCGVGHQLVNDTFRLQKCDTCDPLSYSLDPLDHCEYGADVGTTGTGILCAQRECTRCPIGAFCAGGAQFEPLTESDWVKEYNAPARAMVYRLDTCGPGHALSRIPSLPEEDQCVECPPGSYAMEFVSYNQSFLKPEESDKVEGSDMCLPCAQGGLCYGGQRVVPSRGYWRGRPMTCPNTGCDDGWTKQCDPKKCVQLGSHPVGHDQHGVLWRDRVMMYRCQPGMCTQNRTGLNATADGINVCRPGHRGILCGVCEDGYEMTGRECIPCAQHNPEDFGPMVFALSGLFFVFLTYIAAWRPLFYSTEAAVVEFFRKLFRIKEREQYQAPGLFGRFLIWLHTSTVDIIKIIFGFYQVAGLFVSKVNVEWPDPIRNYFLAAASLTQFDYFSLPVMSCMTGYVAYKYRLLVTTMGVPLVIMFLALPSAIAKYFFKSKFHDCHDQFMFSTLFFLFLVYTATVRIVFEAFACVDLGTDGRWMKADLQSVCPVVDRDDPITFWWALLCVFLYPIGIPVFMYTMTVWYGVSKCVEDKHKRACLQALLDKFKMQNALPEKIAKKLYHDDPERFNHRIKKYMWKVERDRSESKSKVYGNAVVEGLGVEEFRKLLELMGIHGVGFSEIQGMIDRYGVCGKINKDGIRVMIKKVIKTQHVLTGDEDPDNLDIMQLRELSAAGRFETTRYKGGIGTAIITKRHRETILREENLQEQLERGGSHPKSGDEEHHDEDESPARGHKARRFMLGNKGFGKSFSDTFKQTSKSFAKSFMVKSGASMRYNKFEKEELIALLLRRADRMLKQGELAIAELKWDGATVAERHAIEGLGFLINTYNCKYWWFELSEMARKLVMGLVMLFVFDGTHSQIAVGFAVTMTLMCLHLVNQPYRNHTLGYMHLYSLGAQLITYFYGISLSTRELDELGGDKESEKGQQTAVIVLIIDILIWLIPLLDFFDHILPHTRSVINMAKRRQKPIKETIGPVAVDADMVYDVAVPKAPTTDFVEHLYTMKQFLEKRKALAAADPADWNDPGSDSDADLFPPEAGYFIPQTFQPRPVDPSDLPGVEIARACCHKDCPHEDLPPGQWAAPCCRHHGCDWHWPLGTAVEMKERGAVVADGRWTGATHDDLAGGMAVSLSNTGPMANLVLPEFEKDEKGKLLLDDNGDPIPTEVDGGWLATRHPDLAGGVGVDMSGLPLAHMRVPDFKRDEDGELILDSDGNPIPVDPTAQVPELKREKSGELALRADGNPIAVRRIPKFQLPPFQRDENGELVVDGDGNPVAVDGAWGAARHPDLASSKAVVLEGMCCKVRCPHGDVDNPDALDTPCCIHHGCDWHDKNLGVPVEMGTGWGGVWHPEIAGGAGVVIGSAAPMRWMDGKFGPRLAPGPDGAEGDGAGVFPPGGGGPGQAAGAMGGDGGQGAGDRGYAIEMGADNPLLYLRYGQDGGMSPMEGSATVRGSRRRRKGRGAAGEGELEIEEEGEEGAGGMAAADQALAFTMQSHQLGGRQGQEPQGGAMGGAAGGRRGPGGEVVFSAGGEEGGGAAGVGGGGDAVVMPSMSALTFFQMDPNILHKAASRVRSKQEKRKKAKSPRKLLTEAMSNSPSVNLRRIESTIKQTKEGKARRPSMGDVVEKALMKGGSALFDKPPTPSLNKEDRTPAELLALEAQSLSFAMRSLERGAGGNANSEMRKILAAVQGSKETPAFLPGSKKPMQGKEKAVKAWPAADVGFSDSSDDDFDEFWRGEVAKERPQRPKKQGSSRWSQFVNDKAPGVANLLGMRDSKGNLLEDASAKKKKTVSLRGDMEHGYAEPKEAALHVRRKSSRSSSSGASAPSHDAPPHPLPREISRVDYSTPRAPRVSEESLADEDGQAPSTVDPSKSVPPTVDPNYASDDDGRGVGLSVRRLRGSEEGEEAEEAEQGMTSGFQREDSGIRVEESPGGAVSMSAIPRRRGSVQVMGEYLEPETLISRQFSEISDIMEEDGLSRQQSGLADPLKDPSMRRRSSAFSVESAGKAAARLDRRRSSARRSSTGSMDSGTPLQEDLEHEKMMKKLPMKHQESFSQKYRSLWLQSQEYRMLKSSHVATSLLTEVVEGEDEQPDDEMAPTPTILERMASLHAASQKNVFSSSPGPKTPAKEGAMLGALEEEEPTKTKPPPKRRGRRGSLVVFAPEDKPQVEARGVAKALKAQPPGTAASTAANTAAHTAAPSAVASTDISAAPSGQVSPRHGHADKEKDSKEKRRRKKDAQAKKPAGEKSGRRSSVVVFKGARAQDVEAPPHSVNKTELDTVASRAHDVKAMFRDLLKPHKQSGSQLSLKAHDSPEEHPAGAPEHHHPEPLLVREDKQGRTKVRQMRRLLSPDDDGDSQPPSQPPSMPASAADLGLLDHRPQPPPQPPSGSFKLFDTQPDEPAEEESPAAAGPPRSRALLAVADQQSVAASSDGISVQRLDPHAPGAGAGASGLQDSGEWSGEEGASAFMPALAAGAEATEEAGPPRSPEPSAASSEAGALLRELGDEVGPFGAPLAPRRPSQMVGGGATLLKRASMRSSRAGSTVSERAPRGGSEAPVDVMGGLMSGKLAKLNKKTKAWEDRFCVLCTRMDDRPDVGCAYLLEIFQHRRDAESGGEALQSVHVKDAEVKYKQGTVFTIKTTGELNKKGLTYFMSTNTLAELKAWFEALELVEGVVVERTGQDGNALSRD